MSTRLSGSSTQSTGTSWMRSPLRSASTSSSVSKNQPVSSTCGQQPLGDLTADGLESTLGVGEVRRQGRLQDQVVAARDELPLRAAHDPRRPVQPGADRHVGVPGDQRRHQRSKRGEVGGQVDVHVGQHRGIRRRPHRVQRASAALLLQSHDADTRQRRRPVRRRSWASSSTLALSAMVMRAEIGKVLVEVAVQPAHRTGEGDLFVVHRHHHVEHRHTQDARHGGRVGSRCAPQRQVVVEVVVEHRVRHATDRGPRVCVAVWSNLRFRYERTTRGNLAAGTHQG